MFYPNLPCFNQPSLPPPNPVNSCLILHNVINYVINRIHKTRTLLNTYASNDKTVDLLRSHILDIQSLQAKLSFLFVTLKNAESSVRASLLQLLFKIYVFLSFLYYFSALRYTDCKYLSYVQILLKLTVAQDVLMIADTRLLVAGLMIAFSGYITGVHCSLV